MIEKSAKPSWYSAPHRPLKPQVASVARRRTWERPPPRILPVSSIASRTRNESIGIGACGRYEHS